MSDTLSPKAQDSLYHAALKSDHDGMEAALAAGARPDELSLGGKSSPDTTPLHMVIARQADVHTVDLLVNWGANIHARMSDGATPFLLACKTKQFDVARALLEAGANHHDDGVRGLVQKGGEYEELKDLLDEYEHHLPGIDASRSPETLKQRLLRQNDRGFAPLDNPKVWRDFDRIGVALLKQGTPLAKDDLFDINRVGRCWIDKAIDCRALDKVLSHLHAQGDYLSVRELTDDPGLLEHICDKGGVRHLFTLEQLRREGTAGMRELQAHIPELTLAQVPNRFQLASELRAADACKAKGPGR